MRTLAKVYGVPVVLHTDHCAKKILPWVDGVIAASEEYFARNGEPLFSSHMLDLSEEPLGENIEISARTLKRLTKINATLEIELGITGGEEDGVDNSGVEHSKLYTQPEDVLKAYDVLNPIGSFTVAAAFGNTHGVYAAGNVKLKPTILRDSQKYIQEQRKTGPHPVNFVFHGGSGSSAEEISEAVSYGVVKMNIDTDTQWAFTHPIKKFMDEKGAYLNAQIGNPEGPDKPNKKYIDPRGWLHLGEKGITGRLVQAFQELGVVRQVRLLAACRSRPAPRRSARFWLRGRRSVCPLRAQTGPRGSGADLLGTRCRPLRNCARGTHTPTSSRPAASLHLVTASGPDAAQRAVSRCGGHACPGRSGIGRRLVALAVMARAVQTGGRFGCARRVWSESVISTRASCRPSCLMTRRWVVDFARVSQWRLVPLRSSRVKSSATRKLRSAMVTELSGSSDQNPSLSVVSPVA